MIHWTPEGTKLQRGLNFYWNRSYIRIIYVVFDGDWRRMRYFRFRWRPRPIKVFWKKDEWDAVAAKAWEQR